MDKEGSERKGGWCFRNMWKYFCIGKPDNEDITNCEYRRYGSEENAPIPEFGGRKHSGNNKGQNEANSSMFILSFLPAFMQVHSLPYFNQHIYVFKIIPVL